MEDWIVSAITTTLTAVLGVIAKYAWDYFVMVRALKQTRISKLEKLKSLLIESNNLFKMQNKLIKRLYTEVQVRLGTSSNQSMSGYEAFLTEHFEQLTESEKDSHSIIRATTLNSIKRVNNELLDWLNDAQDFKNNNVRSLKKGSGRELANNLSQLELHLNLWQDKFEIWMKNEKHCVVYLADEEHHGVGFPKSLETIVDVSIIELKDSSALKTTTPFKV